jgi:hypothetical protein
MADENENIGDLRQLNSCSLVARWTVREADLKQAMNIVKGVNASDHPVHQLFQAGEDCPCFFCQTRQAYGEALQHLKQAVKEVNDANLSQQQEESDSSAIVQQVKAKYASLLAKLSSEMAETFIHDLVNEKLATELMTDRRETTLAQKKLEVAKRKLEVVKREGPLKSAAHEIVHALVVKEAFISHCTKLGYSTLPDYNTNTTSLGDRFDQYCRRARDPLKLYFDTLDPSVVVPAPPSNALKALHDALSDVLKKENLNDVKIQEKFRVTQLCFLTTADWQNVAPGGINVSAPGAGETKGHHHPLICALLFRIASMQKHDEANTLFDPDRTSFDPSDTLFHSDDTRRDPITNLTSSEHSIWVDDHASSARCIDFIMHRLQEKLRPVLPSSCFLAVDVKPVQRGSSVSLKALHEEGLHQGIGHLAEEIQHYFDLGGIGCNHRCRGIILSLVSIEVLEMELLNVGTKEVDVKIRRTQPYFLFNKEITKQLLQVVKLPDFKFDDRNPYLGFQLLEAVLRMPTNEVPPVSDMHLWYKDSITAPERPLGEFLGSGSFSFVYRLDHNPHVSRFQGAPVILEG